MFCLTHTAHRIAASSGSGETDGLTAGPLRNSSTLSGPIVVSIAGGAEQSASRIFQTSVRHENGIVTFLDSKPIEISLAIELRVQYHSSAIPFCGGTFDCCCTAHLSSSIRGDQSNRWSFRMASWKPSTIALT